MSSEIQLVLIGGLIAIASSIATSVLAHWLEKRREKRALLIELSKVFGHAALRHDLTKGEDSIAFKAYLHFIRQKRFAPEDLAFVLGTLEMSEESHKTGSTVLTGESRNG